LLKVFPIGYGQNPVGVRSPERQHHAMQAKGIKKIHLSIFPDHRENGGHKCSQIRNDMSADAIFS
jgi:hypothetical protein